MRRILFLLTFLFLSTGGAARGQSVHAGVMVGPTWAVGEAQSNLDTGYGVEGWVAVDLPGVPVTPRVAYAVEAFMGTEAEADLDTRSGRLDLLVGLPVPLPGSYGFVGGGYQDATYGSLAGAPPAVASTDAELALAAGVGLGIGLGPVRGTVEGRYVTVPGAEFQALQLRVGLGF